MPLRGARTAESPAGRSSLRCGEPAGVPAAAPAQAEAPPAETAEASAEAAAAAPSRTARVTGG